MQLNCDTLCFVCGEVQDVKVNYTLTHGVCNNHRQTSCSIPQPCKFCSSDIKFLKEFPKSLCSLCNKHDFTLNLKCPHSACLNCIISEKSCLSCENSISTSLNSLGKSKVEESDTKSGNVQNNCIICGSVFGLLQFSCKHFICSTCERSIKVCSVCPDKCDVCKNSYLWESLPCKHRVCYDCKNINNNRCMTCIKSRENKFEHCLKCIIF